nr:MAG TPA: hypothetical protein [Caudoviricetes sp.]
MSRKKCDNRKIAEKVVSFPNQVLMNRKSFASLKRQYARLFA